MMQTLKFFPLILLLMVVQLWADNNWQDFRDNHEKYYIFLEQTDLQNFSCLFTTDAYLSFINDIADSSYTYPLKLIWTREGKSYYILQPYPQPTDSKQRQQIMQKIQMTKTHFQGFYLDWINFLIASPFADIPDSARTKFSGDTVRVSYSTSDELGTVSVEKIFFSSGKLLRVAVTSPTGKIINFPKYTEVENKWLCSGWDTQIMKGDSVFSGLATGLEIHKISNYWMPVRADVVVQTVEKPGEKFISQIFIKDYVFNIPLQKLPSPNPPENPKPEN
jgi:hypothetical protein